MPLPQPLEDVGTTISTVPTFLAAGTLAAMAAPSQPRAILPGTGERSVAELPSCVAPSVMLCLVEAVREMRTRLRSGVAITIATMTLTLTLTTGGHMALLGLRIVQSDARPHRAWCETTSIWTQDSHVVTDKEDSDRSQQPLIFTIPLVRGKTSTEPVVESRKRVAWLCVQLKNHAFGREVRQYWVALDRLEVERSGDVRGEHADERVLKMIGLGS